MKKLLLSFIIIPLLSVNLWATDFTVDGVAYYISNSALKTVSIGTGNTTSAAIGTSTTGNFTIPASVSNGGTTYAVTSIGPFAFRGCTKLTSIGIPGSITRITSSAFEDCSGLTSIVLPNSVVSLGGSAFFSCVNLASITFSNSLTTIGVGTFQNCPKLTSINLPNSLTTIGDYAFAFCSGLTSVTIPDRVTSIGKQAFKECSALSSIYLKNSNPSAIALGEYLFYLAPVSTCKLYVPAGSKSAYQVAYQWSDFANNTMEEGKNALHFDGANDYVAIPPVATNLNTFTIEMWIKPNSVPATGDIALLNTNSWDGTNGSSVHFQMESSKILVSVYGITTGWPSSNYTPVVNTWQHIAVTYDRPNNSVRFYINGVLVSTVNKTLPVAKIDAACIGAWGATQRFFNGAIDEVRIWSTLRTGNEIADNKDTPLSNPATIPGLLAYYDFNQGVAGGDNTSASVLLDGSASELNGTLNNFAKTGVTSNFVKGYPTLNLSTTTASVMAFEGSTATVNVTSTTSWTAASDQTWLTVSPASGTDNGVLTLTATANPTTSNRTAVVTVSGTGVASQTVTVTQAAAPAAINLSTTAVGVGANENLTATVDLISNADWTAVSDQSWLTISPASGTNNGTLTLTAKANLTFSTRTAIVSVTATAVNGQITTTATKTITVTQAAGVPTLSLPATTLSIGATGGSISTINITSNVDWTAASDQSWLTVSPASGTGNGTLTLTAAVNPTGATREATITVSGTGVTSQTVTVTQNEGLSTLSVSATTASIGAVANSTATVDVTSNTGRTATSDQSWLTVSPASAIGNGTLTFTATSANTTGAPRTATVTVSASGAANQTITVTQQSFPLPAITSLSPMAAEVGSTVTITGSNFNTASDNNIVFFGATRATVTNATATALAVVAPSGASYGYVTVTDKTSGLTAYSPKPFVPVFNATSPLSFAGKADVMVGNNPKGVAIVDIDNNGKPELISTNVYSDNISVLPNTGTTGAIAFGSKTNYAGGARPQMIATADFNGDGTPDYVVANNGSGNITVYANYGFYNLTAIGGDYPTSVAVGDIDGDGKPDIIVGYYTLKKVSVLRNITSSSISMPVFAGSVDFDCTYYSQSLAVGDIDGDGKPDIAVANHGSASVSVLRNSSTPGNINFDAKADFTTGSNPSDVKMGDIDQDGKPDLIVVNQDDNTISVLRNNSSSGAMSFEGKVNYPVDRYPQCVALGDLDGDGKVDIAVSNGLENTVSIFNNQSVSGTVSMTKMSNLVSNSIPSGIAIGDLNGDGKPEIVTACGGSNYLSVFQNTTLSVSLSLSASTVNIAAVANSTASVNITANTSWTATSDQTWLTISPESGIGTGTLTFTAAANPTTSTRTATVTVSATGTVTKTITVTQATNISTDIEMLSKGELKLYPNPTDKGFSINIGNQKSVISIYDLSGSLMLTKQISGKSYIDVTALPSGIYVVKANGRIGKLIKK